MNTSTRRLLGGLATAAVLLLGQGGFVRAADPRASPTIPTQPAGLTGNEMLSVQPSLIILTAKPGETTTTELTVRAAANLAVTITPKGLGQGTDGNMTALAPEEDSGGFSARSMITASPENLEMKPGDKVTVKVNVATPANVGDGTRYAILTITGMPPTPGASSNVGFGVELGVSAIIQIGGTTQSKTGEIDGIDVGKALPGQPLPVNVSFKNTGNTHFGAVPDELLATAILQDASGNELASSSANGNQLSIIPGFLRVMTLSMATSKALVDGSTYHIEVGVGLKDGTIFDRKAMDFTWSGGQVLSATGAPVQTTPISAPTAPSSDTSTIVIAAVVGAVGVVLLLQLIPLLRRRGRKDGAATPGGGAGAA